MADSPEQLPPLVEPEELVGLPGGPFSAAVLQVAGGTVRRLAGWHIAPQITETLTLDHDGSSVVHLPTKHVVDVSSVEALDGSSPRALSGWRWSADGMLEGGAFPAGFRVLRVTLTHGYESCPGDLLPVIAGRAHRRTIAESLAGRSVQYDSGPDYALEPILNSYRLRAKP